MGKWESRLDPLAKPKAMPVKATMGQPLGRTLASESTVHFEGAFVGQENNVPARFQDVHALPTGPRDDLSQYAEALDIGHAAADDAAYTHLLGTLKHLVHPGAHDAILMSRSAGDRPTDSVSASKASEVIRWLEQMA